MTILLFVQALINFHLFSKIKQIGLYTKMELSWCRFRRRAIGVPHYKTTTFPGLVRTTAHLAHAARPTKWGMTFVISLRVGVPGDTRVAAIKQAARFSHTSLFLCLDYCSRCFVHLRNASEAIVIILRQQLRTKLRFGIRQEKSHPMKKVVSFLDLWSIFLFPRNEKVSFLAWIR